MKYLDHIELLSEDFSDILDRSSACLKKLDGATIMVTGGSGFFGTWLAHSFFAAMCNNAYNFDIRVVCRDPGRFIDAYPYFKKRKGFHFHAHNVVEPFPFKDKVDYLIHAATSASAKLNAEKPLEMIDTILAGTRHALDFAVACKVKSFLFTSSGAVYGSIPYGVKVVESALTGPDLRQPKSAYAEAKRMAELLCAIYSSQHSMHTKLLRCFAFIGPFMNFDAHFAAGNFILDGIRGMAPHIKGDHRTVRSYLYGADLVNAILLTLANPTERSGTDTLNVGSSTPITIAELAETIRHNLGVADSVTYAEGRQLNDIIDWYVPNIDRLQSDYTFEPLSDLALGIKKTSTWLQAVNNFRGHTHVSAK